MTAGSGTTIGITTNNGGSSYSSWNLDGSLQQIISISCPSQQVCVAVGDTTKSAFSAYTLNASSWNNSSSIPSNVLDLFSVSCETTTTCVAVGDSLTSAVFLYTTNSGNTWQQSSNVPSSALTANFVYCYPGSTTCYVSGETTSGTPFIAISTNSGQSFTQQALPSSILDIYSITCYQANQCVAVGDMGTSSSESGAILINSTGSWTLSSSYPTGMPSLYSVGCISKECIAAGNSNQIYESQDGGSTWQTMTTLASMASVNSISCNSTCYLVGSGDDTIAVLNNGNWQQEPNPLGSYNLNSISCFNATTCFAAGAQFIIYTTYGGTTLPSVTSVLPNTGSTTGGQQVQITGTGFNSVTQVLFGNSPANFSVQSPELITATTPANNPGVINVTVVTQNGDSLSSQDDRFLYVSPGNYVPLAPYRVADTRAGTNQPYSGQTLSPGATINIQISGTGGNSGVPTQNVGAVVVNLTAVNETYSGYLTTYPTGLVQPLASSLNFKPNQIVANLVTVALGENGEISIYNGSKGNCDIVVDVEGYFTQSNSSGDYFTPVNPTRIADTRPNTSEPYSGDTLGPNSTLNIQATSVGPIPSNATAVVINVTAILSTGEGGYLTVYPQGTTLPLASNLNFAPDTIVPNRVIVPVGPTGQISIYNFSGYTNIAVDVNGYFTTSTGYTFTELSPTRICDTRASTPLNQCSGKTLGPKSSITVTVAGLDNIATNAVAVVANITATNTTAISYLTVFPANSLIPLASDLNFFPGESVANLTVTLLNNGQINIYNASGYADVIVDVTGFYS